MASDEAPRRLRFLSGHVAAAATAASSEPAPFKRILIANRGEIACRIHRAAKALGIETVGVYTQEDAAGLHRTVVDKAIQLPPGETPVAPYIDAQAMAALAAREGCNAVHPGYGFLSEREDFAEACEKQGVVFVGPKPKTIDLFGDKTKAKKCAGDAKVPILESSPGMTSAEEAQAFLKAHPMKFPLLLKASYGGGGRGQAVVEKPEAFVEAFSKCSMEAKMSFGRGEVFIERLLQKAHHIEVQILGDGTRCVHVFERDCSVQLRKQKVVEIAPAEGIAPKLRERICSAAVRVCESVGYRNAGTVEFLVEGNLADPEAGFYFLELNPRIQVEHTITEEVTGLDLVQLQLRIAGGKSLNDLGIHQEQLKHTGFAIQVRVGLQPGGGGKVTEYKEPPGVRVDSSIAKGTEAVTAYDPMIAKVIVRGKDFSTALSNARKAVEDYVVDGLKVNKDFLDRLLGHKDLAAGGVYTTWVEDLKLHMTPPKAAAGGGGAGTVFDVLSPFPAQITEVKVSVGQIIEAGDVVAVLSSMKMLNDITTHCPAKVLEILVQKDQQVNEGVPLVKLEQTGDAPAEEDLAPLPQSTRKAFAGGGGSDGQAVSSAWYAAGQMEDEPYSTPVFRSKVKEDGVYAKRVEHNKGLVAELDRRLSIVRKGGGGKSEELHRSRGKNLVRERIGKIIDKGTAMMEISALGGWEMYGGGIHSGGVITGIGLVGGREVLFIGTDATIKGGVTFPVGYKKFLRAQEIAQMNHIACVYLIDGGGAKLDSQAGNAPKKAGPKRDMSYEGALPAAFVEGGKQFYNQARMSAMGIPQIAVVCGMCTAGGAYTPAMCDESIIIKDNGTVYLGGPPLVKAATGEDADEQSLGGAVMHTSKSGTCDHFAPDEDTGLAMCREIIENLGGRKPRHVLPGRIAPEPPLYDPESLLGIIPENTNIPYDIREVIARIVDGSRFHEFKAKYGPTMICGWAYIEGYPVGILGNNGMLFSESAIKATHFVQICGKRGVPLIFLHNITGFIIGTAFEQGGITKDGAKMINAISNVPVAKFSVVCGGSFGAGNYAMCGPAFDPRFTFIWPGARVSVMGGEQAAGVVAIVKQNGLKRDGKAQLTPEQEAALKEPIIRAMESKNSAWHSTAGAFDDGMIDPRDTRKVLAQCISISLNAPPPEQNYGVFRM